MKTKYLSRQQLRLSTCSLLLILLGIGCKKFVEISPPSTQLASTSVFDNGGTATAAVIAIYDQMVDNTESYNMALDQGLMADELTNYSTFSYQIQYYTNLMLPAGGYYYGPWKNAYNYIYQANAVITNLQNNSNISAAIAQQLTGEAKFIRAFWNFYLTNIYGDIPLVTSIDYTVNESLARTPQSQVYNQIIQDLLAAQNLLNPNYVDETDTAITTQRVRPTQGAANALLARVYLYAGKYDSAKIEASKVIGNSQYQLCTDLSLLMNPNSTNYVFMANSTEAIWQLSTPLPNSDNTADAQDFILPAAPNTGDNTTNSTTISPQLLNAFEPGDLRRSNWVDSFASTSPVVNYYYPYKYQAVNTSVLTEYIMVLRLGEQYLIRAEAEANLGDMVDAAKDLDTIRARAGLGASTTLTASSNLQQADSAILHERQVELFTEWGHRWFDLVRMDSANIVMGAPGNVCKNKGGVWSPDWQLFPIPQPEILNDPHLTQNLGY